VDVNEDDLNKFSSSVNNVHQSSVVSVKLSSIIIIIIIIIIISIIIMLINRYM